MKTGKTTALFITILLAVAAVACGKKAASTPTEAFKSFYEASKNKDVAAIKSLMSKQVLADAEKEAKSENKSLDEFIATESQKGLPATMPETRNEKIEGDKATLEVKGNRDNWSTISFIKEDGSWKITM